MYTKILVCGGNGAGKSTLARALAQALNYPCLDIEDYYFPDRSGDAAYTDARSKEDAYAALLADMQRLDRFALAAVQLDLSPQMRSRLDCAVFIDVPAKVRMARIRARSYEKFGVRMLPGGDLHAQEEAFFRKAKARSMDDLLVWLQQTQLPLFTVDGTQPPSCSVQKICNWL